MILLLGTTTYVGQAFARALRRRKDSFIPLSRQAFDYTRFEFLFDYVRKINPDLLINAAEVAENGDADPGELDRLQMLQANTLLPQTIARVCDATNTPWAHVSSGSIYSGAKILDNGQIHVETALGDPAVRTLYDRHPERFLGFNELDRPNFSFQNSSCTFYSGTKALAEEAIRHQGHCYVWRFHLPFNELDDPGNHLSQLQAAERLFDSLNSLSHADDCVGACLELWERRAPYGIYNVVNPGAVATTEIMAHIQRKLRPRRSFDCWANGADSSFGKFSPPRADCILDASKLFKAGVRLRPATEAIEKSLEKWQPLNGAGERREMLKQMLKAKG